MQISKSVERALWRRRQSDTAHASDPIWGQHIFLSGIDHHLFNAVLHPPVSLQSPQCAAHIKALVDRERLPATWRVDVCDMRNDFPESLAKLGLNEVAELPYLAASTKSFITPARFDKFELLRVSSLESLRVWAEVVCLANLIEERVLEQIQIVDATLGPPCPHTEERYVGLLCGEPVSAVSLLRHQNHCGVYSLSVVPDQQGKSIGSHMLRLLLSRLSSSELIVLQSSPGSERFYLRLGFEEVGRARVFIQQAADAPQTTECATICSRLSELMS